MATIITSKQRVYLNADRTKAVPDGHKEARTLLVAEGSEIREEDAEKYPGALKLIKGGKGTEQPAPDGPNTPATAVAPIAPVETPVKPAKAPAKRTVKIKQSGK